MIQNLDARREGFNDPTPAAPVGGNSGTTVGQQRLNAFKEAARIWGTMLDSAVPIVIASKFSALACSGTGITLGQARASGLEIDQPGAALKILPLRRWPIVWQGSISNPGMEDIDATFNGALSIARRHRRTGTTASTASRRGTIQSVMVLLHEFGHGSASSPKSTTTGALAGVVYPDASCAPLRQPGQHAWSDMTDDERVASMQNVRHLRLATATTSTSWRRRCWPRARRAYRVRRPGGFSAALAEATFGPLLSAGAECRGRSPGKPVDGCCNALPEQLHRDVLLFAGRAATVRRWRTSPKSTAAPSG